MTQKQLVSSLGAQSTPTFLLRKDGSRQVNWFIGLNGQPASPGIPEYLGLKYLLANRPWAGAALPMPPAEPAAAMPTQVRN